MGIDQFTHIKRCGVSMLMLLMFDLIRVVQVDKDNHQSCVVERLIDDALSRISVTAMLRIMINRGFHPLLRMCVVVMINGRLYLCLPLSRHSFREGGVDIADTRSRILIKAVRIYAELHSIKHYYASQLCINRPPCAGAVFW